ncbi:MAG TPA: hypothetical protein VNK43_10695 [Gemmatimonadales bacterium]|nr:hypothetical protein [Gemmatimonadales bacterium]
MGRRGIKEYRPAEALVLIAADRDQRPLVCPTCGAEVERNPKRLPDGTAPPAGRVTLHCTGCSRSAIYLAAGPAQSPRP